MAQYIRAQTAFAKDPDVGLKASVNPVLGVSYHLLVTADTKHTHGLQTHMLTTHTHKIKIKAFKKRIKQEGIV